MQARLGEMIAEVDITNAPQLAGGANAVAAEHADGISSTVPVPAVAPPTTFALGAFDYAEFKEGVVKFNEKPLKVVTCHTS